MIRVLFVCLGNICRSTMAEGVFRHKVRAAGLGNEIEADSAGTGAWHIGEPPHHGTSRLLAAKGIPYHHAARQIHPRDLQTFAYVLTMDEQNYRDVQSLSAETASLKRFLDFAPQTGVREVPDPYFTGNFEEVYGLVEQAAEGLLATIRREHNL